MAIQNVIVRGYGPGATIPFVVTRGYTIGAEVAASAIVSAPALTEPLIVNGGQVITITLTNDTWVAAGNPFDQVRQIIINGMTSAQTEDNGWNKEVRDKESITSVVRTSNTLVTITLTASLDYDITVNEVITVTVPDEALVTSTTPLIATPTIDVTATTALLAQHFVLFTSTSKSATFSSESYQGATFQSVSNATAVIKDTPTPLGFLLTEDGGIILQENDLPIALE